jgi:metal-sulfur cluster biosynthetic enzyme
MIRLPIKVLEDYGTEKQVYDALSKVLDTELGRNLVELGMIKDLKINLKESFSFTLRLP